MKETNTEVPPLHDAGNSPGEPIEGSEHLRKLFQTAKAHVPSISSGSKFGKYLIKQVIAERAGAWLVRAEDSILNRTVILKIDSSDSTEQTLQNATTEGRAIAAVNHRNIVQVWGVECFAGRPFLVLEHIDGMTLEEFCGARPISETTALNIATQIAEGLAAIHQRGLLHLDLKPSNIMVTREGVVKIIDFGLSRRIDEVSFNQIEGTLGYLAPERCADSPHEIGMATDIFGLGAVVYNMLTALSPFAGETKNEIALNSVRGRIANPQWGQGNVSRKTKKLVDACLERSPQQRPKTAEAILKNIQLIERQFLFRKLRFVGAVLAICLLLFAISFPHYVVSANSFFVSPPDSQSTTPMVVMFDGEVEDHTSRTLNTSDISVDESPSGIFERLHDHTQELTFFHLKQKEFSLAEQVQLKTAQTVEEFFPDAVDFRRTCEVHAAIFRSFTKLPDEARVEVHETVNLLSQAKQEYEAAAFPGNDSTTRLIERAFNASRRTLGTDHGWTLMCQGEYVLAQLSNAKQPLPTMSEFDSITQKLNKLYGGSSKLVTELNFLLRQRLVKKFQKQGIDRLTVVNFSKSKKERDPMLNLIDKHSQQAVSLAQQYFQGRHSRQVAILSSFGMFEYFWMNEKDRAIEYCRKAVRICEDETGTESNGMIQALLILAEHYTRATQYETAIAHLRQARSVARRLVDGTKNPASGVGNRQAEVAQTLLDQCNERIAKLSLRSTSTPKSEKQL